MSSKRDLLRKANASRAEQPVQNDEQESGTFVDAITQEQVSFVSTKEINAVKRKLKASVVDPRELTSIKMGFYMKPKIKEAFTLHKMLTGKLSKADSQIINDALEQYLGRELEALAHVSLSLTEDERVSEAFKELK